jgi:signal transduction histidine kinase
MTDTLMTKETKPIPLRSYALGIVTLWSALIAISLVWNLKIGKSGTFEAACIEARTAFEKDVYYRRWNALHGGVYAPVTQATQPNPYLDVPERDITTPSGKKLTKINPAYMTRQVHEIAMKSKGVKGHITSLNPIRPANAPDPWETQALKAFQHGVKEVRSVEKMEGKSYMRLIRPLLTEKGCLKCHATQGYKLGDIRGGISVSVPMTPFLAIEQSRILTFSVVFGLLWVAGLLGIGFGVQRLSQQIQKRIGADALEERCPFCVKEKLQQGKHLTTEIVSPKDGRFYHVSHSSIFHVDGSVSKMAIYRDITEQKRMEEEILKKNQELENFAHTVSHDLKSPLVSLQGFVGVLVEENKDRLTKNSKHITERIISNINHMERLIHDLLELSRVGRISGLPVEIGLKDLFEQLAMAFEMRLMQDNIKLEVSVKEGCVIHADREQVNNVMDNLLGNAVKFMGDREDRKIELTCRKKEKSHVQICVKDNGIGIDPQYHEKIFEIFKRMNAKNTEGTGVGLALVKKIVEGLGGKVRVESEVGKGAEFWVEMPISH